MLAARCYTLFYPGRLVMALSCAARGEWRRALLAMSRSSWGGLRLSFMLPVPGQMPHQQPLLRMPHSFCQGNLKPSSALPMPNESPSMPRCTSPASRLTGCEPCTSTKPPSERMGFPHTGLLAPKQHVLQQASAPCMDGTGSTRAQPFWPSSQKCQSKQEGGLHTQCNCLLS